MNKYIKTDIEQGIQYLKIGIMNAFSDIENEEEKEITFEISLPLQLVIQCAEQRGWKSNCDDVWTNGWEIDYCYKMTHPNRKDYLNIIGSLLCGNTIISIENEKSI